MYNHAKHLMRIATTCFCYFASHILLAQCADYTQQNAPTPDACNTSYNLVNAVNQCKKVCIDMTTATGSTSPIPSCGSGTLTNDIWLSMLNPYANIPGYDGSLVFGWKSYPGYPNNNPTVALHLDVQGSVSFGFIPLPLSINCTDGFLADNITCTDNTDPSYDAQLVLGAGTVPTNAQIRDLIISSAGATNATVNSSQLWMQIETFNNVPGIVCFEVSTYQPGFSCGDPNTVTFTNTGITQTQNISGCLCNSAQNSGYFNPANTPCSTNAATFNSTTAYYQITAPYACNQFEIRLLNWGGTGDVNVSLLGNLSCPDIVTYDAMGNVTGTYPGLLVDSADVLAEDCLNTLGNNYLSTPFTTCLPAGTYWLLISGAADKSNYTASITVNNNTPVVVQASAILEGAYTGSAMTTNLTNNQQLPLTQPFNRPPWNYFGTESVANAAAIPANTVDWVLLEVRDAADKNLVAERKAAFLLSNGAIVDVNGTTNGVNFFYITANTNYHLAVKHRNHLGAITANAVLLPNAAPVNFTNAATAEQAATQLVNIGGAYALRAGDLNADGIISFSDINTYASQLLGTSPYRDADCNLSGTVSIVDFNLLRPNIGAIGVSSIRQ